MTATLVSLLGVVLCAALLAVLLRTQRPELALCLCLGAGALVVVLLAQQLVPLVSSVRSMMETGGVSGVYLTVVLKAAGIALVTQLAADTCRDAGETALAVKAELVGRVLLLVLAVPLFEQILSLVTALIREQAVMSG